MISELRIENYKSISELSIKPKKFNLLIGRPNVGKSNILEAIALLGLPNLLEEKRKLSESGIRCLELKDLFHDLSENIKIESDQFILKLDYKDHGNNTTLTSKLESYSSTINGKSLSLNLSKDGSTGYDLSLARELANKLSIRPYFYDNNLIKKPESKLGSVKLSCPHGENLFDIIMSDKNIYNELKETLFEYGFEIFEIEGQNGFFLHKKINDKNKLLPFYLLADTLKRYLFHYTAINTNTDNILLFEEPESHSYPPYIHQLAQNIVASDNQYFIATHSPYLYEVFMKECKKEDLAIYYIDYLNHNTVIKEVPSKVLAELRDYDTDIFFNIESQMNG